MPNDLLTGLESYWELNETSGTAIDVHGTNDLAATGTPGTATGKISGARDYTTAQYHSIADNASIHSGDIDFTFSLWLSTDSTVSIPIKQKGASSHAHGYQLEAVYSGGFKYWFKVSDGTSSGTAISGSTFATGTWYHFVIWHDSVNNEIGIVQDNGTPVTTAWSAGHNSTDAFLLSTSAFDGRLDEVGYWKRVLSSTDISDLYNSGSGLAYSSFESAATGSNYNQFLHSQIAGS